MTSLTHKELVQNYEVIRVLGEGSFGKVFLVRNKETRVEFAMKKYSKYHILKNGKEKGLIRSSTILQALQNKQIIKFLYYTIGVEDDEIFLIFEACKKGSLEEIKEKIFEMKQMTLIKEIMYQLAQGLFYLKSVAVAHRDLKPSNISFNSQGQLKIIDFDQAICFKESEEISSKEEGFAKELMQQTSSMKLYSRRSRANSFVGTEMYMSPEMKNMTITDERGDIWAYGCILFELLSGRSLLTEYEEDDEVQITIDRLHEELMVSEIEKSDMESAVDLLKKVLQENPDKRLPIQTIMEHEFFNDLRGGKRGQYKRRLRKFLRGNFNLSDPRNILDALNMDLIGMKSGPEKFLELSQHPVLLEYERRPIKEIGRFGRLKQRVRKLFTLPNYKVCYILGGSRYFKKRSSINQNEKSYIFYDEIDVIKIVNDSIIIEGSNTEKWNKRNDKDQSKYSWRYQLKSITNDAIQLGILYDTLQYICND